MERTPLALGLVGLCQFLPMFLLTLPAGDVTDRFNQRRVYSLAACLQALCSALFLALSIFRPHTGWMYYVVLLLFGAARGFAGPSGSSLLPFLVPPERFSKSMAFSSSFFTAATISGPALGGFLYGLGPVHVYSICIAGFVGAALIVSRLGGRRFVPEQTQASRYERVAEGVQVRAFAARGAGRDFTGPVCGAAGRSDRAPADLCPRHPACRAAGLWLPAQRAGGGRFRHGLLPHPLADQEPGWRQDVRYGGAFRHRHHRVRSFHLVPAFAAGAVRPGRVPTW